MSGSTYPTTLATGPNGYIGYTPWGAVSQLENGCADGSGSSCANIVETYAYNNRMQMVMAELGNTSSATAISCRVYNFYAGASNPSSCAMPSQGSTNNGNVAGYYYLDSANSGLTHTASYGYDTVNRLTGASATGNVVYSQAYSYDVYGNLSCTPAGPGCVALSYNTATNQITTSGYSYDAAGNVIGDGTFTYTWDAESHLAAVYQSGSPVSLNTYNALGQRVEDITQTATTDEAYGAGGNLLVRYTGDSNSRSFVPFAGGILAEYYCGGLIFDHPDEIGSATTATDCTGNNVQERLYYPFGEFWTGVNPDNLGMHQMFAQLPDYDPETDQYNTDNRHYSPTGRWMSPDPGGVKVVHLDDPQTWNMYAYVRNNPTTLTDPSGLASPPPSQSPSACVESYGPGPCSQPPEQATQTGANTEDPDQAQNQTKQSYTYTGGNTLVLIGTTTTTSTDANGNTITTKTTTSMSFSTDKGHEGEYIVGSAAQTVTTSVTSANGTTASTITPWSKVSEGQAAQSLGSAAVNSAIAETVPGMATMVGRDLAAHKGELARSAVEVGLLSTPLGEAYEGAKVTVEVWWAAMGALKAATSPP